MYPKIYIVLCIHKISCINKIVLAIQCHGPAVREPVCHGATGQRDTGTWGFPSPENDFPDRTALWMQALARALPRGQWRTASVWSCRARLAVTDESGCRGPCAQGGCVVVRNQSGTNGEQSRPRVKPEPVLIRVHGRRTIYLNSRLAGVCGLV